MQQGCLSIPLYSCGDRSVGACVPLAGPADPSWAVIEGEQALSAALREEGREGAGGRELLAGGDKGRILRRLLAALIEPWSALVSTGQPWPARWQPDVMNKDGINGQVSQPAAGSAGNVI